MKGTPYTDEAIETRFRMSYMIFKKDSAQVIGILSEGRMAITDAEAAQWHKIMTPEQFAGVFGPPTHFEANGILDIYFALYGGLVNKPTDAIEYALVLMQTKPALAHILNTDLSAMERDKVWHITLKTAGATGKDLLSFSRSDGKVLSGDL